MSGVGERIQEVSLLLNLPRTHVPLRRMLTFFFLGDALAHRTDRGEGRETREIKGVFAESRWPAHKAESGVLLPFSCFLFFD
jgi:hypothetical protein